MATLERRVEALERQSGTSQSVLLVIGEPTPEQQAAIDEGRAKVAVYIPDNSREAVGTHEPADSTAH